MRTLDNRIEAERPTLRTSSRRSSLPGIKVVRSGRIEPFLGARPTLTSANVHWRGVAVEDYRVPACVIPRHEHIDNFVHVILDGGVRYEVSTGGKCLRSTAQACTTFVLPRGTVDELRWAGPTHRIAVAVQPSLLVDALDETTGQVDIELTQHWTLVDRNITALLVAMTTDLDAGSPGGQLYGESLANALAVYLLGRYAVRRRVPRVLKGSLPQFRLKRVLEYVGDNLTEDLGLAELAALAGMSPHYFCELFKRSMGCPPHRFVLLQRIERAKELLRDPILSVLEVGVRVGFQNPSHFARMFHRFVGITPSGFRSDQAMRHFFRRNHRDQLIGASSSSS